jgi:hypothetical protein
MALTIATTTKFEGDIWATGQQLAAEGEDGFWQRISGDIIFLLRVVVAISEVIF